MVLFCIFVMAFEPRLCIPFFIPFFWTPPNAGILPGISLVPAKRNPQRNFKEILAVCPWFFLLLLTKARCKDRPFLSFLCLAGTYFLKNICRNGIPAGIPGNPAGMHNLDSNPLSVPGSTARILVR
jgi:hypothetical protein